ncbi:MAG: hypothetical protein JOZ54_14945 [Acidobacteria bacterium]|nr:hypothetical protein [Acidobacteriota bacterium]
MLLVLSSACGSREKTAKTSAIETSLKPFSELAIPTGSRLNVSDDALAFLRRAEAAGLVHIEDVPQGYWDSFASRTFMEGAKPVTVTPTANLEKIALNPRPAVNAVPFSKAQIAAELESSWNYYAKEEIYLGANCVGNATSFGNVSGPCALALQSDYPTYTALAGKGLLTIKESSIAGLPAGSLPDYANAKFVATIGLTSAGQRVASVDAKRHVATFVLGTYRLERLLKNEPIQAESGVYRLVEGTHVFAAQPEFADTWAALGRPTYRERHFRVLFTYDTASAKWKVANATNGRYTAEDVGPRDGGYECDNVPPTLEELRRSRSGTDQYTWRVRLGDLHVAELLRDEDYKGPLSTPGETFRLVLATIKHTAPSGAAVPSGLENVLPGRLRCILKYSDFNKAWTVVALDVGPRDSEQWNSANVR